MFALSFSGNEGKCKNPQYVWDFELTHVVSFASFSVTCVYLWEREMLGEVSSPWSPDVLKHLYSESNSAHILTHTHINTQRHTHPTLIQHLCLLVTPWWKEREGVRSEFRVEVFCLGFLQWALLSITLTCTFTHASCAHNVAFSHAHTQTHTRRKVFRWKWLSDCFLTKTLSLAEKQTVHLSGYQIVEAEIDFTYNSHIH